MDTRQAYNSWAAQYDTNQNRTRDLEALSLRNTLSSIPFDRCLEIGCGTGKNTVWLTEKAKHITAVDLSEEMLAIAREKVQVATVHFKQADITQPWAFTEGTYDLVTFSLVLEHIEELAPVFKEAAAAIHTGGYVYIGELHPFKQYAGTKARFDTEDGRQIVTCFNHNITDFTHTARQHGLTIVIIEEYFDNDDRSSIPRILTLLLQKS